MNAQLDLEFGRRLKRRGMARAAGNRSEILEAAKDAARYLAGINRARVCNIDWVMRFLNNHGYDAEQLGNAAGSVFKGREWVFTGEWIPSQRPARHAGMIRVWRLKEAA